LKIQVSLQSATITGTVHEARYNFFLSHLAQFFVEFEMLPTAVV